MIQTEFFYKQIKNLLVNLFKWFVKVRFLKNNYKTIINQNRDLHFIYTMGRANITILS